ncbi:MAG: DUF2007 domain-containing protein [Akkermansiaceae bacterium]
MKVVRTYSLLMPAQLAQLELRSHGIESVILDEHVAMLTPFAMDGGIRLAVSEESLPEAQSILENASVSEEE